jgi:hypothetical protein
VAVPRALTALHLLSSRGKQGVQCEFNVLHRWRVLLHGGDAQLLMQVPEDSPDRHNIGPCSFPRFNLVVDAQLGSQHNRLVDVVEEGVKASRMGVTPDFRRGTKCISYVRQDQFTHI